AGERVRSDAVGGAVGVGAQDRVGPVRRVDREGHALAQVDRALAPGASGLGHACLHLKNPPDVDRHFLPGSRCLLAATLPGNPSQRYARLDGMAARPLRRPRDDWSRVMDLARTNPGVVSAPLGAATLDALLTQVLAARRAGTLPDLIRQRPRT